jgi:fibronectin-binding autotransporter adhesin
VQVAGEVDGGTLKTSGAGVLESSGGSAVLNGVTIASGDTYTCGAGTTTELEGTITNTGATISASGGTVQVAGTIDGGTLKTASGGVMESAGASAVLDGATIASASTYTAGSGTTTQSEGTITNHGTLAIDGGGGGDAVVTLDNSMTRQTPRCRSRAAAAAPISKETG